MRTTRAWGWVEKRAFKVEPEDCPRALSSHTGKNREDMLVPEKFDYLYLEQANAFYGSEVTYVATLEVITVGKNPIVPVATVTRCGKQADMRTTGLVAPYHWQHLPISSNARSQSSSVSPSALKSTPPHPLIWRSTKPGMGMAKQSDFMKRRGNVSIPIPILGLVYIGNRKLLEIAATGRKRLTKAAPIVTCSS